MSYFQYLENKQHETDSFPVAYYWVDPTHPLYFMPLHWHKETELLYVRSGELELSVNGTVYMVRENELCYIPDGCVHGGVPKDCTYECIDFDLNAPQFQIPALRNALNKIETGNCIIQPHFTEKEPKILKCADRLIENLRQSNDGWEVLILAGFLELYGTVMQMHYYGSYAEKSTSYQKILRLKAVLEHIDANYAQAITLNDLSRIAGMCPKYFCKAFRDVIHRTPIDYLNAFRVEKACGLLTMGKVPITEVAFQCGFNDSCYFTRCFKKYKGTTPKQFALEKLSESAADPSITT